MMDLTQKGCNAVILNRELPVRCSEEVLLPFFTDVCLHVDMDSKHRPEHQELRLVLLGRKGAGKSAAGNTILGGAGGFESGKPTEECVERQANVAGKNVTVVDTPGWEWYYPLNSTPNWVRRETLRSVSLCKPGPHALLLVVRSCTSVTEEYIREMEEHLEPLGRGVWEHTMLLFTRGDELGLVTMEQRIRTSGPGIQRLLQKCMNRYHVVDNRSKGDGTQVTELIRKLEGMVEEKRGGSSFLEMDNTLLMGLEADAKRSLRERRKKQRQMENQMQRAIIKDALITDELQSSELDAHHSFSKAPRRLLEVRLVLLGERETGKSSAGNTILGKTGLFQFGTVTEECGCQQAEVDMWLVTVVDTPGWEAGVEGATPERVKREIVSSVALCPPGPHALLLTLRVDTLVMAGHVREHLELFGEGVWRHIILLFTHGDQLREGVNIAQHIQGGGRDLQWILEKCRGRYHVISNTDVDGSSNTVTELLKKVEKMAAMNRCEAYSGLVQEVRDLTRQRNENFNHQLKVMEDKMLRQEAELKNMREREMKSIRFFDWKRKQKSPIKTDVQREDEEEDKDKRTSESKNENAELEERIRWLTEDKEREIQDLLIEKERMNVELKQSISEKDEAMFNLELREREIEELKDRTDEQQVKLLDLECASVENEKERKQMEDTIRVKEQEWLCKVEKLEEKTEVQKKEEAELMEKIVALKTEIEATKRHYEHVLERKAQEKNIEMAEIKKRLRMEEEVRKKMSEEKQLILNKLKQYEEQMQINAEEIKLQCKKEMEEKEAVVRSIKLRHQEEVTRKFSEFEKTLDKMKSQHRKELEQKTRENADDKERIKQQYESEKWHIVQESQKEIAKFKEQFAKSDEQMQAKKREMVELEELHYFQIEEKKMQNEEEIRMIKTDMMQKMQEKEKEIEELKIQHEGEMAMKNIEVEKLRQAMTAKHKEEVDRKVKDAEKLVERMQHEYSDGIRKMEEEKQGKIKELRQQCEQKAETQRRERQEIEKEIQIMKEHAKELEQLLRQTEEERENHRKQMEQELLEKEIVIENLNQHIKDIDERTENVKGKQEEEEMKCLNDIKEKLKERESEIQSLKKQSNSQEAKWRNEERKKEEIRENEMNILRELIKSKTKEITEAQCLLAEKDGELEEAQKKCENCLIKIQELEENQTTAIGELLQHLAEQEKIKDADAMKRLQEKDEEMHQLQQRDRENEKELQQLRLTIEQTRTELKNLTSKMEKEAMSMIQEYEREIARRNEDIDSIKKERDCAVKHLEEECQQRIAEVTEKYAESRRTVEELQEQNEKMRKDRDNLRTNCEELMMESEDIRKHVEGCKQQLKSREEEIQGSLNVRDEEVRILKDKIESMKEREGDAERQVNDIREDLQTQLMEMQSEIRIKEKEMEKELIKREKELGEREQVLSRNEEEMRRRGHELDAKEEELVEKEVRLERRECEIRRQKEAENMRAQRLEKQERELETLLQALEDKQEELDCHGRDLQNKVKELKDREHHLRNEEQGLLNWRTELQMQNDHVNSTTQQLDNIGRDMALLKEELCSKETKLKASLQRLSQWECNLKEREEELLSRERSLLESRQREIYDNWERDSLEDAFEEKENSLHLTYQGIPGGEETGSGSDRRENTQEGDVQRITPATSAAGSNKPNPEPLKLKMMAEERERMPTIRAETKSTEKPEDLRRPEVIRDCLSKLDRRNSHNRESDLRVMVIGESWSSNSPAGVSILGGEASKKQEGSTFRHWKGEVAGQHLNIVEPLGLRWRNGPDPSNAVQMRRILDSSPWCGIGPHAVLLLVPAFLTCTQKFRRAIEEHMALLGADIWQRTLVVFTWGEILGEKVEQHILRNGELMGLVEKCRGRYHVVTSTRSNRLRDGLFKKMEEIVSLNNM